MIKISGLKKVYSSEAADVVALENVSLEIGKGEIFGIIGLSGAGKSTLIRCMNLLEKPTAGSIEIDGQDITKLKGKELRQLRSSFGMIFQHFNLLMQRKVKDNIAFPLEIAKVPKAEIRTRVNELLELVGLTEKAEAYPAQLSGGQKQRVAIARALANNPKVLLCDEATSALDAITTKSILALLKDINLKLGLTIVLITHEIGVIKEICHLVAVMDSNHIVEVGPVIDVMADTKTPAARNLVGKAINKEILSGTGFPAHTNEYGIRIKVTFTGKSALQPVISNIVRRFDVDTNILFGNIDFIQGSPLGELVLEITGDKGAVENVLNYLTELELKFEVVDNV